MPSWRTVRSSQRREFPRIGYIEDVELQDRNKRRKYGLKPIERARPPSDLQARMDNGISRESDWINLDTTVSTSPDQIALAPGYLQREWTANGRRYFHYKTTAPILGFVIPLRGYEVRRTRERLRRLVRADRDLLRRQASLHRRRMSSGVRIARLFRRTLAVPSQAVRILEFPATARSRSRSRTPFPSPSIGFIAYLRYKDAIDTSSTSPRMRSRTSGAHSHRATCRSARAGERWRSTRADGVEKAYGREKAEVPENTSWTATCATRQ